MEEEKLKMDWLNQVHLKMAVKMQIGKYYELVNTLYFITNVAVNLCQ